MKELSYSQSERVDLAVSFTPNYDLILNLQLVNELDQAQDITGNTFQLFIKKDGVSISGSPYTATNVDVTNGKIKFKIPYTTTVSLAEGDYNYLIGTSETSPDKLDFPYGTLTLRNKI